MFEPARYVSSDITVGFPRRTDVETCAEAIAAKLEGRYRQHPLPPMPDELGPDVPRLAFLPHEPQLDTRQLLVLQTSFRLELYHQPDRQEDPLAVEKSLLSEIPGLFNLLEAVGSETPTYCGLTTHVRLRAEERRGDPQGKDDRIVGRYLAERFLKEPHTADLYELTIRFSETVEERFFSNTTYEVYRSWDASQLDEARPRLSGRKAAMHGMLITGDFNDRYAFNENEEYTSDQETAEEIVHRGMVAVACAIAEIRG